MICPPYFRNRTAQLLRQIACLALMATAENTYANTAATVLSDGSASTLSASVSGMPTSGLVLWLKPDAGLTVQSGLVARWADQSGNGNDAVQGTLNAQPRLVAGAANGLPAIQFDGSSDALRVANSTTLMLGNGSFTISYWMKSPLSGANNGHLRKGGAAYNLNGAGFEIRNQGNLIEAARGSGSAWAQRAQHNAAPNVWSHMCLVYDQPASKLTMYVDGTQVSSAAAAGTYSDTYDLELGRGANGFFQGEIAELMVYRKALVDTERQGLRQYLANRYTAGGDRTPLTVSITSPGAGVTVSQRVILNASATNASATDSTGVTQVQYAVDNVVLGSAVTVAPYTATWDTTAVANGTHTITAIARDAAGNIAAAAPVTVQVQNATATSAPHCGAAASNAFTACYYDNQDLTNLKVTRVDNAIDFNWGKGSPHSSIAVNSFSVRWEGDFTFEGGVYNFAITSDDGIRLYVDGQLILDKWISQIGVFTVPRTMTAGVHRVRVDYFDGEESALVRVGWTRTATAVPSSDTTAPTVPGSLKATAVSASQINLSWTGSTDNVGVAGYRVYRNGTAVGNAAGTSYSSTGLAAGVSYSYTVAAYDAAGNQSAKSAPANAATAASVVSDGTPPSVPSGLRAATASATQINLAWTAATDNVGVAGYRVYRNGALIATATSPAYASTGLSQGATYSYTVAAFDAAGNQSAQSVAASATTGTASSGTGVDIRAHGAACNGVTNDTPAVLAAIRAVPASGGTVDIPCMAAIGPPGIVVDNRSNLAIRGTSAGAGFKAYTSSGSWSYGYPIMVVLRSCVSCAVRDLQFEGNHLPVGMLRIERNTGTTVENNVIRNTGRTVTAALMGMAGRSNRYIRNTVDTTANEMRGIWIGNPGNDMEHDPVVTHNTVRKVGATGLVGGLVSGGTFSYNVVENNTGSGMKVEPLARDTKTVVFEHNRALNNLWAGITIGGAATSVARVSVRNNHAEGNRTGISLDAMTTGDLTGNVIINNNRGMPQGWLGGLYIIQAKDLVVERNRFHDTNPANSSLRQDQGIMINPTIANGVVNLTIRNNWFDNHLMDGVQVQARFGATISGLTIHANSFVGNSRSGINIMSSGANTIRNVTVFNNCFTSNKTNVIDTSENGVPQQPSFASCTNSTGL